MGFYLFTKTTTERLIDACTHFFLKHFRQTDWFIVDLSYWIRFKFTISYKVNNAINWNDTNDFVSILRHDVYFTDK